MKYRDHRAFLDDSMETVREIGDKYDLLAHLRVTYADLVGPVEVNPYGFDARIGWDTHIVTIDGKAVGFTDGPMQ